MSGDTTRHTLEVRRPTGVLTSRVLSLGFSILSNL